MFDTSSDSDSNDQHFDKDYIPMYSSDTDASAYTISPAMVGNFV